MVGKAGPRAGGSIDHISEETSYTGMYVSCDVAINRSVICSMGMAIVLSFHSYFRYITFFEDALSISRGRYSLHPILLVIPIQIVHNYIL